LSESHVFDPLTRENIGQYVVGEIGRPKGRDARVRIVECGGRRAILKDVHDSHRLFRFLLGRRFIRREFRICRRLDGVRGVPHAYRMLDKDAFLAEYVPGSPLSRVDVAAGKKVPPEFYDRSFELVAELHRRGVVHMDLRNRKNFLFTPEGEAYVVDFASALHLSRWLPFRSFWLRLFGSVDRAGVLKMKRRLSPELLTDDEAAELDRIERTRNILLPYERIRRWFRRSARNRRKAQTPEENE